MVKGITSGIAKAVVQPITSDTAAPTACTSTDNMPPERRAHREVRAEIIARAIKAYHRRCTRKGIKCQEPCRDLSTFNFQTGRVVLRNAQGKVAKYRWDKEDQRLVYIVPKADDNHVDGTMVTEQERAEFAQLAAAEFEAELTGEQVDNMEANAASPEWATVRRIALALLSRSKAELLANMTEENALAMLDSTRDLLSLADLLQVQADAVRRAHARVMIAVTGFVAQEKAKGGAA